MDRAFQLVLEAGSPVLQSNVDAEAVDGDGKRTPFRVNPYDFFTGHLAGELARPKLQAPVYDILPSTTAVIYTQGS